MTMVSEDSITLLSACDETGTLQALKEAGFDLESLRDKASGENPLHRMCRMGASQASIRRALSLCPAWGEQIDSFGFSPASRCENPETAAALEKAIAGKLIGKAPKRPRAKSRGL